MTLQQIYILPRKKKRETWFDEIVLLINADTSILKSLAKA